MKKIFFSIACIIATINVIAQNPTLIKDILPGGGSSYPGDITDVNGTLLFTATDNINGRAIWKSNGTPSGTVLIKSNTNASYLTNVNGILFYVDQQRLWKSDGTSAGTILIKDSIGNNGKSYGNLINVNGTLFFTLNYELWKSDGTTGGTVLVKSLPHLPYIEYRDLINVNSILYFRSTNDSLGEQLWRSDGTNSGTYVVNQISTITGNIYFGEHYFCNLNGQILYQGTSDHYLYKAQPAQYIKDVRPDFYNNDFAINNGNAYFAAAVGIPYKRQFWKSDGTAAGTQLIKDIDPKTFELQNNVIYFSSGTNEGELWKTDGTTFGSQLITTLPPIKKIRSFNNSLYIITYDTTNLTQVWKSDGTASGTSVIKKFTSGSWSKFSYQNDFIVSGKNLFLSENDGASGTELWAISYLPKVSGQPKDANTCQGANSAFSVVATNVVSYTWEVSTDGGSSWSPVSNGGVYSNATTATLSLTSLLSTYNNFKYRCQLGDGIVSNVVTLFVTPLKSGHKTRTVCSGESVKIGNNTYISSGVYTNTLKTTLGCDSVATDTLLFTPSTPVEVNINVTPFDSVCKGTPLTFNAFAINPGSAPVYKWYVNGTQVGTNSTTYSNSMLSNKDSVYVTVKSSAVCPNPKLAISQKIILKVIDCIPSISVVTKKVSCRGHNDGSITLTGSGGMPPYAFNWQTGDTARALINLNAGIYYATITDANSQTNSVSIKLDEKLKIKANIAVSASTNGKNGQATAQGYGGIAPYAYSWNTLPVQTTETATGLNGGKYYVLIIDSVGCLLDTAVTIPGVTGIQDLQSQSKITLSPNPFNSSCIVTYEIPSSVKVAFFKIYDVNGRFVKSFLLDKAQTTLTIDGTELQNGIYFYNIELDRVPSERKKMVVIK